MAQWDQYKVNDTDTNNDWSKYAIKTDSTVDDIKTDKSKTDDIKVDKSNNSNTLSSLWDKVVNNPTIERLFTGHNAETDKLDKDAGITNIQGPGLMTIPGIDKLANKIKDYGQSSGNYWGGFAGSIGKDLLDLAGSGFDPRTAGIRKSPNDLFPINNEESAAGKQVLGRAPVQGGEATASTPSSNTSKLLMKDGSIIDHIDAEEHLNNRPDLVPVGDESSFNDLRYNNPVDLSDKTYDLASSRQNMGRPNLSVDEVNKLFSNPAKLEEGTTINFGNKSSKLNSNEPRVTSLKPATPELIEQAQAKGPDVIHLKTADKTQLENAAQYGYKFEGVNSDGSLRLRKNAVDVPSNESPNDNGGNNNGSDGGDEPPNNNGHIGDIVDRRKATIAQEVMNLPRGIMASWDLSAPFRQGLGLIHRPEWWKSWGSMFKSFGSENAFRAVQDSIANKPLFKQFEGQPSFAEKAGLKLTDLTNLNNREEQIMSTWAEKIPGVRPSNRAYTAFLNKLRADSFESLMDSYKILNKTSGEYNMPLAQQLAGYVNTATGRGSLGSLEKYAPALNSILFSPRLIASRLQLISNPVMYMTSSGPARNESIKSLLAIAGTGALVSQLGKLAGGTVENDPTSSDFGKLKIGNTRIDPFGGFQQYIIAANRLLQGRTVSSVSGRESELNSGKFGSQTKFDVVERFGESKLNPLIGLAITILRGKNLAGQKVDLPEEVASKFVPLFIQDLKNVATENPNLIPGYKDLGLDNINPARATLSLPGAVGFGIQNYPSK